MSCAKFSFTAQQNQRFDYSCPILTERFTDHTERYAVQLDTPSQNHHLVFVFNWMERGRNVLVLNPLGAKVYSSQLSISNPQGLTEQFAPLFRDVDLRSLVDGVLAYSLGDGLSACSAESKGRVWFAREMGTEGFFVLPELRYNVRLRQLD